MRLPWCSSRSRPAAATSSSVGALRSCRASSGEITRRSLCAPRPGSVGSWVTRVDSCAHAPGPAGRVGTMTHDEVIALAEELAAEFGERAAEIDKEGRFPHENFARLKESGYLTLPIPEDLGGGGADLATVCKAQSILAGGCASTALAVNMHLFGLGAAAESVAGGQDEARMVLQLAATGVLIG